MRILNFDSEQQIDGRWFINPLEITILRKINSYSYKLKFLYRVEMHIVSPL